MTNHVDKIVKRRGHVPANDPLPAANDGPNAPDGPSPPIAVTLPANVHPVNFSRTGRHTATLDARIANENRIAAEGRLI